MPSSFFVLPPELRIQVYSHLIASCLANGNIAGVTGLQFSCHELHHEIQVECIAKIQPLIDVMHHWAAIHPDGLPLCVTLPKDYLFTKAPTSAIISIPSSASWHFDYWFAIQQPFKDLVATLRPLFDLAWSDLTLCVHSLPRQRLSADTVFKSPRIFINLFRILVLRLKVRCQNIDRLVLQLSNKSDITSQVHIENAQYASAKIYSFLKYLKPTSKSWLAGKGYADCMDWTIGYDFVDGLPEVKNVMIIDGACIDDRLNNEAQPEVR